MRRSIHSGFCFQRLIETLRNGLKVIKSNFRSRVSYRWILLREKVGSLNWRSVKLINSSIDTIGS